MSERRRKRWRGKKGGLNGGGKKKLGVGLIRLVGWVEKEIEGRREPKAGEIKRGERMRKEGKGWW